MTASAADLLLYSGALLILFLTPGPVWLAITARALSGGFGAAWPLALGVSVGDILWPLVAVLGISWILSVFDTFMAVLRLVACGVFIVMGLQLIRHANARIGADSRLTRPGRWAGFAAGLVAILGNPKAVLFYMGVLPGFFDLRTVSVLDVMAIIFCSVAIPLVGNLAVAALVGHFRSAVTGRDTMRRINLVCGVLLICVGLLIPLL
ncbi:LysE family translocator [Sulfitobacter sp. D35]|uniref:LysE family translocator n=1 Tax=Sulfitobacter sp. D35 TaxID=3083252 RepID=UPI00296F7246|nr:LysE family translocator [Sulfitobacter sp. D35]MDW4498175.1 LysE family translocator [Sulfitobacter sp. D35]